MVYAKLLDDPELEYLLSSAFGSEVVKIQTRTGPCLSLDDLFTILRTHRLEWPRLRFFADGTPIDQDAIGFQINRRSGDPYWQLNPVALQQLITTGVTITLDRIDQLNDQILAFCLRLEAIFDAPVFANAYASWGSVPGFGRHWDDHDVLAWQLEGSRRWDIWPPTRRWPFFHDVEAPEQPPDTERPAQHDIAAGDVLHVPAGWWHGVQPVSEPSLHVTFGIQRPTGVDLLKSLAALSVDCEALRQPLSIGRNRGEVTDQTIEACLQRHLDTSDGIVDRFLDHDAAQAPARHWLGSVHSGVQPTLPPDSVIFWLVPRARLHAEEETLLLRCDGREIEIDPVMLSAVECLLSDPVLNVAELEKRAKVMQIAWDDAASFVFELEEIGLVGLVLKE